MGARAKIKDILSNKGNGRTGRGHSRVSSPTLASSSAQAPVPNMAMLPAPTDIEPWAHAFRMVQEREPQLMVDYKRHLASLQDDAVASADLSTTRSVESIVKALWADREKKQWRVSLQSKDISIREQAERLVKLLLWSDQIVKAAASTQPYTALAWSGASLLLPLLTSGTTQNAAMLEGFNSIGDLQVYWQICEETYLQPPKQRQHYQDLLDPLAKLYSHIIEYQARVICQLSKSQLSRAWQHVAGWNDWNGKKGAIDALDKECRAYIPPLQEREARERWGRQLREIQKFGMHTQNYYEDQKQTALLRDLASDYEGYKNFNPRKVEGTCEWFYMDDTFLEWRDSNHSCLLWVSAGPGCGKSVLCRALIDERLLSTNVTTSTICHFFFKDGDERRVHGADALSAILHQLFTHDPTGSLIGYALSSYKNLGKKLAQSFFELWQILVECAESPGTGEIVCILDALDECDRESREQLIEMLRDFYCQPGQTSKPPSTLKFLITSRPYDNLEAMFRQFSGTAAYRRFDGDEKSDQISSDINLVIDARLPEIASGFEDRDCRAISELLKSMENRTYLWLYLTFDVIKQSPGKYGKRSSVEALLSNLPSQVSEAYEKILCRADDPAQTEALLQIVLAAARPLTLEEANVALTLALSKERFTSEDTLESELWPTANFRGIVRSLCGLFVSVYDSELSFIHQTAREFLVHDERKGAWQGRLSASKSHGVVSRSCLQYLLLLDTRIAADDKQRPFLSYAASNWPFHFLSQGGPPMQCDRRDARELCCASKPRSRLWWPFLVGQDYHLRYHSAWADLEFWHDLTLASYLGLATIAIDIIDNEHVDVNAERGYYRTALLAATRRGYPKVIEAILGHGQKVRITEEVLKEAAGNESSGKEMLALLLDHRGSEFKITEEVLRAAAGNENNGKEIMALLLDQRGSEFKVTEKVLREAVRNASSGKEIMALLLDQRGSEFKITEKVVTEAAGRWNNGKEIMALLLERRGTEMEITEKVVTATAHNSNIAKEALTLLLDRRWGGIILTTKLVRAFANSFGARAIQNLLTHYGDDIKITQDMVQAAAGNESSGEEIMALLLDQRGPEFMITEEVVMEAARNRYSGKAVMALLLERRGTEITITEGVAKEAAMNERSGKEIMGLLLDQRGAEFKITEEVLRAAAGNKNNGKEIMALLLDQRGSEVKITEEVLRAAVRNASSGKEIMALLLDQRGSEFNITEEVLRAAAGNEKSGKEIVAFLLDQRGSEFKITEKVVGAAAWNRYSGKEIMALLLDQRGSEVKITEEIVTEAAGNWDSGKEIMALLDHRRSEFKITEEVVRRAARNERSGKEMLALLLNQRGSEFKITEEVLRAAAGNEKSGKEIVAFLLDQRGSEFKITEKVVKAAAWNRYSGKDIMALLLDQRGSEFKITGEVVGAAARCGRGVEVMAVLLRRRGTEIKITEEVVRAAAGNEIGGTEIMALLLDLRGTEINITEQVVKEAARNRRSSKAIMALLLDQRDSKFKITEEVVMEAARNRYSGKAVMALLLERRGTEITITEGVAKEAARNKRSGKKIMALLLDQCDSKFKITEEVLRAAARNERRGKEIMELFLDQRGSEFRITEEVVREAARNERSGKQILALLLDQRGSEFKITEEVVTEAAGNWDSGKEIMALFLDQRGSDFMITEDVVREAARNERSGKEIMALLLDQRGSEFKITEEVVRGAARNRYSGKAVTALLLERRGTEITITEGVAKEAARNRRSGKGIMALLRHQFAPRIMATEEVGNWLHDSPSSFDGSSYDSLYGSPYDSSSNSSVGTARS